jgi:hypothetical protein
MNLRADALERSGLPRVKAERRARLEFGSPERFLEECRENIAVNFFDTLMQDLRFSLRTLAKQPLFAAVAIVTLAIGIGMSTLMLSVVEDILFRPLPYAHSERLYAIWASSESMGQTRTATSGPDFVDYLEQNRSFAAYLPYLQDETKHDMATMSLFLRANGNAMALADSVRDRIHTVAPDQPVQNIQNVADLVSQSVATRRYTLILIGAFAAMGLLLAAIGVYGVISYVTAQRTREFGVRVALGATRGRVISEVLRGGLRLTVIGLAIGTASAFVLTRSLSALLFEISPLDPLSYSAAVVLLAFVSICACLVPAWRASRVDSIVAMQSE